MRELIQEKCYLRDKILGANDFGIRESLNGATVLLCVATQSLGFLLSS